MQFYFQAGELAYINHLINVLCKSAPNRSTRRNLARLAAKFDPTPMMDDPDFNPEPELDILGEKRVPAKVPAGPVDRNVFLKPSDRQGLTEILTHGEKALANTRSQFGQRGFFNKAKSVLGVGSEVQHLEKAEGVLTSVLNKIKHADGIRNP